MFRWLCTDPTNQKIQQVFIGKVLQILGGNQRLRLFLVIAFTSRRCRKRIDGGAGAHQGGGCQRDIELPKLSGIDPFLQDSTDGIEFEFQHRLDRLFQPGKIGEFHEELYGIQRSKMDLMLQIIFHAHHRQQLFPTGSAVQFSQDRSDILLVQLAVFF